MTRHSDDQKSEDRETQYRNLEARVTQLETQLAHTEHTCDQLNQVITELSLDAKKRERLLDRIVGQLKDLKNKVQDPDTPSDERPPHY